jgi:pimeloyl-ACP methyl ester carboxylesterase
VRPAEAPSAPVLYADSPDGSLIAYRVFEAGSRGDPRGADALGETDAPGGTDASAEADAPRSAPTFEVPVVLVHGFASNARVTWERTGWVSALRDAGHAVITVDLRGHGESDKPAEASAYLPERLGDDLVAVLDSAGVDRVDILAYSMGNRALSAFATAAPGRLRRAIVGGAGPNELFASWDLDDARGVLVHGREATNPVIEQVLRPAVNAGADRSALLACIEGVAGAPLAIPAEVPVLFVAGERDPVPAGVEAFAAARGSGVVRIAGRDHVSTLTSREFKTAALAFFADEN